MAVPIRPLPPPSMLMSVGTFFSFFKFFFFLIFVLNGWPFTPPPPSHNGTAIKKDNVFLRPLAKVLRREQLLLQLLSGKSSI